MALLHQISRNNEIKSLDFSTCSKCNQNLKGFKTFFLLSCLVVYSQFSLNLLVGDDEFSYIAKLKKGNKYKAYQIYEKKKRKKKEFEYLAINSNFKFNFFSCCISFHVTPLSSPYSLSLCHIVTPKVFKVSNFNKTRK